MHGPVLIDINPDRLSIIIGGETFMLSTMTWETGGYSPSRLTKLSSIDQWLKLVYQAFLLLQKSVPSNIQNISGESARLRPLALPKNGSPIGWMSSTSLSRNA